MSHPRLTEAEIALTEAAAATKAGNAAGAVAAYEARSGRRRIA